jgi:hypothetical protein
MDVSAAEPLKPSTIIARRSEMHSKLALASLALLIIGGADVALAGPRQAANPYECFTDDGYGRKRSCSQGYRRKSADKAPTFTDCMTDDGYGRKRSCSQGVKPR